MIGEVGLTEIGVFYLSLYFVFQDRDLCVTAPDSPGTHSKDQIGLQLTRDPLTSASQVLALKLNTTKPGSLLVAPIFNPSTWESDL